MPQNNKAFFWIIVVVAIIVVGGVAYFSNRPNEENNQANPQPQVVGYQDETVSATHTPALFDTQGNPLTIAYTDELTQPVNTTVYACAGGKEFKARVEVRSRGERGKAEVFLKDGSKMLLNQTLSGSGVRYANKGESFVFWTKGDTAFIQEGDMTPYADCVAK